jgi:hypothetical protein
LQDQSRVAVVVGILCLEGAASDTAHAITKAR